MGIDKTGCLGDQSLGRESLETWRKGWRVLFPPSPHLGRRGEPDAPSQGLLVASEAVKQGLCPQPPAPTQLLGCFMDHWPLARHQLLLLSFASGPGCM